MKTLKNVVEGMGIGALFDAASIFIGKGIKKVRVNKAGQEVVEDGTADAVQKAVTREADVNAQVREKAVDDLKTPNYSAYKNRDLASPCRGTNV